MNKNIIINSNTNTTNTCSIGNYIIHEDNVMEVPAICTSFRHDDIRTFFGEKVSLHCVAENNSTPRITTDNYYGVSEFTLTILAIAIYSTLLYFYRNAIFSVVKSNTYSYLSRKLEDSHDINIVKYMKIGAFLSYLFIAILIYGWVPDDIAIPFNKEYLLPSIFGAVLLYALWRRMVVLVIVYLSQNIGLMQRILFYDNLVKSSWLLVLAPISLLSLSDISLIEKVVEYIGLAAVTVMIIQQLIKLFIIFNEQNISFFQYILYLCATEFIPLSFITTVLIRQLG